MQQLLTGKTRFKEFKGKERKEYRLGDLLKEVKRPLEFDDDAEYDLISVRRRSGGLFLREKLSGHQIKTKDMSVVRTGDFLISKMQVLHGASGLTTEQFDGKNISGSYIALVAKDPDRLSIQFFDYLSRTPYMYHIAYISSYGVHIEKMTFNLKLYLKSRIRIPSTIEEQERICSAIDVVEREITPLTTSLEAL